MLFPQFSPETTTVLKYVGSVTAALYGIYATVTDFHETRHGKRRLTTKGYLGLALLAAASSINIFSDYSKDQREKKTSEEAMAAQRLILAATQEQLVSLSKVATKLEDARTKLKSTSTQLAKTGIDTRSALNEARRSNDPMEYPNMIRFSLSIPANDTAVAPYLQRVGAKEDDTVDVQPTEDKFPLKDDPQEKALATLATMASFQISFATKDKIGWRKHLSFDAECKPTQDGTDPRKITYSLFHMAVQCEDDSPKWSNDDGTIRSRLDLVGKTMEIEVVTGDGRWIRDPALYRIPIEPELEIYLGRFDDSKRWVIRDFNKCGMPNVCLFKTLTESDVKYYPGLPY